MMMGRRRVRTAVLAMLAALPLMTLSLGGGLTQTAGAADLAEAAAAFEPEPGSVHQECGPRWWQLDHWVKRCGQSSAGYGRTGYYHSDTNRGVWDEWRPFVTKYVIRKVVLSTDGDKGCFIGYLQFRRASDGHTLTHGTQVLETTKGPMLQVGYLDHDQNRFHPQGMIVEGSPRPPHKYPGEPKPSAC